MTAIRSASFCALAPSMVGQSSSFSSRCRADSNSTSGRAATSLSHAASTPVQCPAVEATTARPISLRRFKDDVTEVREGYECGIGIGYSDIKVEDTIETYEMREKPRA